MEAAFWSAARVTLVGSMTPSATRSPKLSVSALKPIVRFVVRLHFLDHHRAFMTGVGDDHA